MAKTEKELETQRWLMEMTARYTYLKHVLQRSESGKALLTASMTGEPIETLPDVIEIVKEKERDS